MCYFAEMYNTCFSYISQLIKSEMEWVMIGHEHLNAIDDYLGLRAIDASSVNASIDMPTESFTFIQTLKDNLIVSKKLKFIFKN